jgi:hypothetical protein
MNKGWKLLIDPGAKSADPTQPAFIARPAGAPVYHGFPVVPETETEGWLFGAITEFISSDAGDGYVVAPDGSHAGLVWEVGPGSFEQILPPDPKRWGVYAVWFPHPIHTIQDLITNFRAVLPDLKAAHAKVAHGG